jgi:hypothetical protein
MRPMALSYEAWSGTVCFKYLSLANMTFGKDYFNNLRNYRPPEQLSCIKYHHFRN